MNDYEFVVQTEDKWLIGTGSFPSDDHAIKYGAQYVFGKKVQVRWMQIKRGNKLVYRQ